MVQNPKGGGLSSSIGGSQQLGGVKKTTDFLDKSTWTLATLLVVLILLSGISFSTGNSDSKLIDTKEVTTPAPITPAPATPNQNQSAEPTTKPEAPKQ